MKIEIDEERIALLEHELKEYFDTDNTDRCGMLPRLASEADACEGMRAVRKKSHLHTVMAEHSEVKLFRWFPLFAELPGSRDRYSWGALSAWAGVLRGRTWDRWFAPYTKAIESYNRAGLLAGWAPVGLDHHCPGYDRVLERGVSDLAAEAETCAQSEQDAEKREFLLAAAESGRALELLASRFADEAQRLADGEKDPFARENLLGIAEAARRVPAQPPRTFYEGLCSVFFLRETIGSIEGIGCSTYGQLDRMLWPLYEADVAAGRITRERALYLLRALFSYIEVRFAKSEGLHETSSTIVIGGTQVNELTLLIVEAMHSGRYAGIKVLARSAPQVTAPIEKEYIKALASAVSEGVPSFVVMNDGVYIPAEVRAGKRPEDAARYVGGGCHEIVLGGYEVDTRADTWINVPMILLNTLKKRKYEDINSLIDEFIADVRDFHERIAALKNTYEKFWPVYDPLPLYSLTLCDCVERGVDVTAGGARYNSTTMSMLGVATVVDSLIAADYICFREHSASQEELVHLCETDFADRPELRARIRTALPKHGTGNAEADRFSSMLLSRLSTVSGQKNARGGLYQPGFYPHDAYISLGWKTSATPDGRRAGTPLSRGYAPSDFIPTESPTDIIQSIKSMDFTAFPESFVTDITLPALGAEGVPAICTLIETFLRAGGGTLQLNCTDRELLIEAQRDPEQHRDIIVRVCGYSERFYVLSREVQDEIISRMVR